MQQKLPSIILSTKYLLQVQHKACYFNAFDSNVCYQFLFCLQLSIPCFIINMFVHISYSGQFILVIVASSFQKKTLNLMS